MNRFEWFKAVSQHKGLSGRAAHVAAVLATVFANDDTGQINPGLDTLAQHCNVSVDTIRRAVVELEAAGWLARVVYHGRGKQTCFSLLSPGAVVPLRPVRAAPRPAPASSSQTAPTPEKRSQPCTVSSPRTAPGKGSKVAAKRSQPCNPHIRKEQPSEQKERAHPTARPAAPPTARPSPHLHRLITTGSAQADAWDQWLRAEGFPSLNRLSRLAAPGGFDLPWTWPPSYRDSTEHRIARAVAAWAAEEGARHADAA